MGERDNEMGERDNGVCPSERFLDPPSILYMTKLVFIQHYLGLG